GLPWDATGPPEVPGRAGTTPIGAGPAGAGTTGSARQRQCLFRRGRFLERASRHGAGELQALLRRRLAGLGGVLLVLPVADTARCAQDQQQNDDDQAALDRRRPGFIDAGYAAFFARKRINDLFIGVLIAHWLISPAL